MGVLCCCPRTGGLGQGQYLFLWRFLRSKKRNSAAGKRGRAKIPSPQPPSFLPARAFSLAREARRQFGSKKVRIWSNKRTKKEGLKAFFFILVQYSKDSPNAFRRLRRRGNPPAKIRKGGEAAPLTISNFSLVA